MFEQAFKNIDDVLRKEAGCTTELDYTEQTSWLLLLKYLDNLEQDKAMEAELEGRPYSYIIDKPLYRSEKDGKLKNRKGCEVAHVIASRNLAQNQSYQPELNQSCAPNGRITFGSLCHSKAFRLAHFSRLSQTEEPKWATDSTIHEPSAISGGR
jgi:hypothetical protein